MPTTSQTPVEISQRVWLAEEEVYLSRLRESCNQLSDAYLHLYQQYTKALSKYRLPAIVLSSISGVASFGTTTFPASAQRWVSIVVGGISTFVALLTTVEAFYKIGDLLSRSLQAQIQLKKVVDDITIELSLPKIDRVTDGVQFVRKVYAVYQQVIEQAPPLPKQYHIDLPDPYLPPASITAPAPLQVHFQPGAFHSIVDDSDATGDSDSEGVEDIEMARPLPSTMSRVSRISRKASI